MREKSFTCGDDWDDARQCLYTEAVDSPAEEAAIVHLSDGDVLGHGVSLVGEDGVRGNVPQLRGGVELPPRKYQIRTNKQVIY